MGRREPSRAEGKGVRPEPESLYHCPREIPQTTQGLPVATAVVWSMAVDNVFMPALSAGYLEMGIWRTVRYTALHAF
jgi:hypothetical protein